MQLSRAFLPSPEIQHTNSLVKTLSRPLIESDSIAFALSSAVTVGPSIVFRLFNRAIYAEKCSTHSRGMFSPLYTSFLCFLRFFCLFASSSARILRAAFRPNLKSDLKGASRGMQSSMKLNGGGLWAGRRGLVGQKNDQIHQIPVSS